MRGWRLLLGGMIVWAAHFFALYILASIFGGAPAARLGTLLVTLACLLLDGAIILAARRARREDGLDRWIVGVATVEAALSAIAVIWQGLPALVV